MRILHVFRSPVGGLFRHVSDLARAQKLLGHEVGLVCDKTTGGEAAELALAEIAKHCDLGITRFNIPTLPGFGDLAGRKAVMALARRFKVDVIHGHGAKGGVYARLAASALKLPGVYTPHGGSLHYDWLRPPGAAFLAAEKALRLKGSGIIFVCEYERDLYVRKIGLNACPSAVIYNGLWPEDFTPRELASNAADLLFIGEMRALKGVDVLLRALKLLPEERRPSLNLVGEGRDLNQFQALAKELGLGNQVKFLGRMNFHAASGYGRVLIMPSRHESFPYVVLEAVAAGIPVIASDVGGIPEILPKSSLVPVGDSAALANAISAGLAPDTMIQHEAAGLSNAAKVLFNAMDMAKLVVKFYSMLN